ncbi:hypothetical protein [Hyphomicrobium sp. CS1GBMeth3]|uniref:hypothetical protein n=1 Tax=Hyphomicrobium sp. CS1GBMeth3 TaxID=1892845 RepID=UPI000A6AA726|nr:hypothetical protein [Hyphomicrobium sp. CS1GBMeth3]
MDSSKRSLSPALVGCMLLALLTLNWATTTLSGLEEPVYALDYFAFGTALTRALAMQIAALLLLGYFIGNRNVTLAFGAAFSVANAWSMHLVLIEQFADLPRVLKVLALILGMAALTALFLFVARSRRLFYATSGVIAAFIAINVAGAILAERDAPRLAQAQDAPSHTFGTTASPKIKLVEFTTKPNVYLIGFESAAPAATLQRYLGLADAPLPKAFHERGFRVFPNTFSEGMATRQAWHALLAMDADYAAAVSETLGKGHLFAGTKPSPLLQIFKHNGYEITAHYRSSYIAPIKGPHVDRYILAKDFSPCDRGFLPPKVAPYVFWNACGIRAGWFPDPVKPADPIDQIHSTIVAAASKATPQLVIAHTARPVHTPSKGWTGSESEYEDFRPRYLKASNQAVANLDRILSAIKQLDPSAIILAFGDHGPTLSRNKSFDDDPLFFVQDRFGVLAGTHPKDACADNFDNPISDGYYTTPELARLLVRCLAGGKDPFLVPYAHKISIKGTIINPRDHLYE